MSKGTLHSTPKYKERKKTNWQPISKCLDITAEGTEKVLKDVNVNTASGLDNIPNQLLQELAHEIAPSVHLHIESVLYREIMFLLCSIILYTSSHFCHKWPTILQESSLPQHCCNANISLLFKKGDHCQAVNY